MSIVILGANGMLGQEFLLYLHQKNITVFPLNSSTCDITHYSHIQTALSAIPDIEAVINCAAYTQVDKAETDRDKAYEINATGPELLATYCQTRNIPLVHFSTDYIFNGTKTEPYIETDIPDPINYYGFTKLKGEEKIQNQTPLFYIIRVQWLYGAYGKNFVKTITEKAKQVSQLQIVADQWGSPTWTYSIVESVMHLLEAKAPFGIYHIANTGFTNWYKFASYFLRNAIPILPITADQFPTPAKRPQNSRLNTQKFADLNLGMPPSWQNAVDEFLKPL